MAISKQDCILLLTEISDKGIDCKYHLNKLIKLDMPDLEVLKFINDNRQLDVTGFYEKIRKSYNHKKSKLYINIVKNDFKDPKDILTTLASLNLQILLYNKNVDNSTIFLKHVRFEEINKCLYHYSKTYDLIPCQKLLNLIKIDLKVLESIHRENVILK